MEKSQYWKKMFDNSSANNNSNIKDNITLNTTDVKKKQTSLKYDNIVYLMKK